MTNGFRRRNLGSNGFTLLEIMVAFTVLATAVVALLGLRTQTIFLFGSVQERLVAISLAEDRLERMLMKANGFDPVDETSETLWEKYGDVFVVEHEIQEMPEEYLPIYPPKLRGWSMCEVLVNVTWQNDSGTDRKYSVGRVFRAKDEFAKEMGC